MCQGYDSLIEQITQSIFSTMLNIDVLRVYEPVASEQEPLLAAIQITGNWTGCTVLSLSTEVANEAAANMLQQDLASVSEDDRKEVAAELVNMIGGNLKSILPGPSYLSLPTIVAGREFGVHVHQAELLDEVVLRTAHGAMRVQLYSKSDATAC
jgi:chemotaxis protein CheX